MKSGSAGHAKTATRSTIQEGTRFRKRQEHILLFTTAIEIILTTSGPTLPLHPERPSAGRLSLLFLRFRPRSSQHLQEVCRSPSHAGVNVRFASLDMVVEVVAESLNV